VLFLESDEACETSYRDRGGKYQGQDRGHAAAGLSFQRTRRSRHNAKAKNSAVGNSALPSGLSP